MSTPLQAMLWELWRTSRVELLCRIVAHCGVVYWLCGFTNGFDNGQSQVLRSVMFMMLGAGSLFSMTWLNQLDNRQIGFSFRLGFARPVTTTQLVVVPMLYSVLVSVVIFLLPALLFTLLLGESFPFGELGTGIACIVTCFIATTWSPTTRFGKMAGMATAAIGLMIALFVFHSQHSDPDPLLMAMGKPGYFDFAWYYYAACLAVIVIAIVVTVIGVERQRHGDGWQLESMLVSGVSRMRNRSGTLASSARRPFANRFAAQYWYEMRRFGSTVLLFGTLAPLFPLVFLIYVYFMKPSWQGAPLFWLAALFFCPFVYQLVGAEGSLGLRHKQGASQLSAFDATRSMRNDQIIAVKLFVIAVCSFVGWLCMGLTAGLHSVIAGNWQEWLRIGERASGAVGNVPGYWWFAASLIAVLAYISTSSVFLAFGLWLPLYPRRFLFGLVVMSIHVVLAFWDGKNDWAFRDLWAAYGYFIAVVIVAGCILALRKALVTGYFGKRLFSCAFCLWMIYVSLTVTLYMKAPLATPIHPAIITLSVSLLFVPLGATSIAPLALASHRHS